MSRDAVTTITSRLISLALAVVQSVILARWLLPVGRGQYATVLLIPQMAVILAPLGVQWAATYYLRVRKESTSLWLQNGLGVILLLGILAIAGAAAAQMLLYDALLQGITLLAMLGATLIIPIQMIDHFFRGVLRGTNRIIVINIINAARPFVTIIFVVLVIVVMNAGVTGLIWVTLGAELFVMFSAGWIIYRKIPPRPRLDREYAQPLLSYGLRIYAFAILIFLNNRLGMGLLRYFLDYEQVGYYITAVTLAERLWNVPNAFAFVLFPRIAGADKETQNILTTATTRITVVIVCGSAILCALLSYPAIRLLYGVEFIPAVAPFLVLLPGICAMAVQQVLGADVSARGHPGRVTIAASMGVIVNALLNVWWIPKFGVVGAAAAASASYFVLSSIVFVNFLRLSDSSLKETLLLKRTDIRDMWKRLRKMKGGA